MKKETRDKAVALLAAIHDAGLDGLVATNHAFQTLHRIIKTGSSMPEGGKEQKEDTEACAATFSNPHLWGWMEDRTMQETWLDFVVEFYETRLNKGKTA